MTFEETQAVINEFLEKNQNLVTGSKLLFLTGSIDIIYEDLEKLSKGEEVVKNSTILQGILDSLLDISDLTISAPIHNKFAEFLIAFSELVFNWNNNTYKDKTIYILTKFISSFVNSRNSMNEAIRNMKDVVDNLEVMRSWSPASFDVALAYVDEQLKVNEKETE